MAPRAAAPRPTAAEPRTARADGLHDAPVGRARETVPVLRERAAIPDHTRTIPRGTHAAFTEAGLATPSSFIAVPSSRTPRLP
ncbi:MAG: hypothetical protein OXC28_06800 [Defluviicoccus sp.]|nr:hypothetical protein [Defluviicoccus sp.]